MVIAKNFNHQAPLQIDMVVYRWQHLIENFFCKLKELMCIAIRNDKTDSSFAAVITSPPTAINSH